jgi:UDP-N-acetylglucosamine acyltransferase
MIHSTALIDPDAKLSDDVLVGPWSIIGAGVEIGSGTIIESHAVIKGDTHIGCNNHIFQFSSIGETPPDLKYNGEPTKTRLGDNNVIREGVTIHRGTAQDRAETTIGNNNLLMAYVHIGHDSVVGNNTILANNAALAGHVHIGDWANLGGYTLVHQYCKLGAYSFTGMGTSIGKDVPTYITVSGSPAEAKTINSEGLRRRGFSPETISHLRRAYKMLYRQGLTMNIALERLEMMVRDCPEIQLLIDSVRSSERGIVR